MPDKQGYILERCKTTLHASGRILINNFFNSIMKFKVLIFIILTWANILSAQEITLRIAATTDVHGAIFPHDFLNDSPGVPSLASLQTVLDSVRQIPFHNLILLDNGDLIQGTPAAYYANFVRKSRTNLFAEVLNYLNYDAATAGNHDIEAGPEVYNRLQEEFAFPWLGANILKTSTGKPAFEPYAMIERQGIRVAVLGLITPGVPGWLPETLWPGLAFAGIVESAEYWVDHIRRTEKPDAVIGLFHTGMGQPQPDEAGSIPENAGLQTAMQVRGIDVIILGHDHRQRSEKVTNMYGEEVILLNPGSNARNLGWAELVFSPSASGNYRIISGDSKVISLEQVPPSAPYVRRFRKEISAVKKYAGKPVGRLLNPLSARESLFGNSAFTDLIHAAQLKITGAEVSVTAPLTTSENLGAGNLLVRDLFKLYRYENFLYVMKLSGREIRDFLEYSSVLWFNHMQNAEDHLLNFRKDEQGNLALGNNGLPSYAHPSFNFDSAAGIRWEVDVSKPAGQRVRIISLEDGSAFSLEKLYTVAINSYRGSGGGGHLTQGAGISQDQLAERIIYTSDTDIRSMLISYFRQHRKIAPLPGSNWQIVPMDWYHKGMAKDMEMLGW